MTTKKIKGFTIVELLISLAITAMIMVSVAFALNASFDNYGENKKIYQAVNNGRQALTRITTEMRTALVDANTANQSACTLILPDTSIITYRYESDESKLYLNSGGNDYLLCDNVTAMTFKKSQDRLPSVTDVTSVVISMTVQAGDVSQTLSAAAIIRKVLN